MPQPMTHIGDLLCQVGLGRSEVYKYGMKPLYPALHPNMAPVIRQKHCVAPDARRRVLTQCRPPGLAYRLTSELDIESRPLEEISEHIRINSCPVGFAVL